MVKTTKEIIKEGINIKPWALGVLVTLFLSGSGAVINYTNEASSLQQKVIIMEKLIDTKLDKSQYDSDILFIKQSLERIENKLDHHISSNPNN